METEEFKLKLKSLVGNDYNLLSDYVRSSSKVKMKHNICNFIYEVTPNHFINDNNRCPLCNGCSKMTRDIFIHKTKNLVGDEYSWIEDYIKNRTPILIRHNKCGYEYKVSPNGFWSRGNRCPNCNNLNKSLSKEVFMERFNNLSDKDDYKVLDEFINMTTKIRIEHICGFINSVTPKSFLYEKGTCPKCSGTFKDDDMFKTEIKDLTDGEYLPLDTYTNSINKIRMFHSTCSKIYMVSPHNFTKKNGTRCPFCNSSSKGEDLIDKTLEDSGIEYIREKRFVDCRNKYPLPFDFYIPSMNTLIEFDGIQHFKPTFGNECFINTLTNDGIKNSYVKENNINLVRIRFDEISRLDEIVKLILLNKFDELKEKYIVRIITNGSL